MAQNATEHATSAFEGALERKWGPLPVWGWAVALGGALLAVRMVSRSPARRAATVPAFPFSPPRSGSGGESGPLAPRPTPRPEPPAVRPNPSVLAPEPPPPITTAPQPLPAPPAVSAGPATTVLPLERPNAPGVSVPIIAGLPNFAAVNAGVQAGLIQAGAIIDRVTGVVTNPQPPPAIQQTAAPLPAVLPAPIQVATVPVSSGLPNFDVINAAVQAGVIPAGSIVDRLTGVVTLPRDVSAVTPPTAPLIAAPPAIQTSPTVPAATLQPPLNPIIAAVSTSSGVPSNELTPSEIAAASLYAAQHAGYYPDQFGTPQKVI